MSCPRHRRARTDAGKYRRATAPPPGPTHIAAAALWRGSECRADRRDAVRWAAPGENAGDSVRESWRRVLPAVRPRPEDPPAAAPAVARRHGQALLPSPEKRRPYEKSAVHAGWRPRALM